MLHLKPLILTLVVGGSLTAGGAFAALGGLGGSNSASNSPSTATKPVVNTAAPTKTPLSLASMESVTEDGEPGLPPAAPLAEPTPAEATPTSVPPPPPPTAAPTAALPEPMATPVPPPPPTATTAPPPPTVTPRPPAAPVSLNLFEQQMFDLHQIERAKAGLSGFTLDATLVNIARLRAQDMAAKNYFAHTSPTGETAFTLMAQFGYAFSTAGENIARNNYPDSQTASVSMTGFMNSPGHKSNILHPPFTKIGIGYAVAADGMKYFAVVFAG